MNRLVIHMKGKWIISLILSGEAITEEARMDKKTVLDKIPGEVHSQDLTIAPEIARTMFDALRQKMVLQYGN